MRSVKVCGIPSLLLILSWACGASTDPLVPAAIAFAPSPVQVKQGATVTVTARVVDADGTEIPGLTVTLASGNTAIAEVVGAEVGGVAPGSTTLTGTHADLSGMVEVEVYGHPARTSLTPVTMTGGPFGTAITRQGRIYVARHFVDTVSSAVLPGISFGTHLFVGRDPVSLALDSAGERLYVTKQFSQNVGVANVGATTMIDSIPVTGDPFIVVMSPDQSSLFVTSNANSVQKVVLASRQVTTFDTYPTISNGIAFHPSGTLMYVATIDGIVYEYNLGTGAGLRTFSSGGGVFQGVGVSDDGGELYVADEAGAVRIWNLTSGAPMPPTALSGGPFDLKVTPDGAQIWVSLSTGGSVVVLDRVTHAVIGTVPTGGTPRRIAFDRFGGVAVIGNEAGWADVVR
jgi:YVTN family beta-propeller protein